MSITSGNVKKVPTFSIATSILRDRRSGAAYINLTELLLALTEFELALRRTTGYSGQAPGVETVRTCLEKLR